MGFVYSCHGCQHANLERGLCQRCGILLLPSRRVRSTDTHFGPRWTPPPEPPGGWPTRECMHCGATNPERSFYCRGCGKMASTRELPEQRQCLVCTEWSPYEHTFCKDCGVPMVDDAPPSNQFRSPRCACWAIDEGDDAAYCGTCGAPHPLQKVALHRLLGELRQRLLLPGYRSADPGAVLVHPTRSELTFGDDDVQLWLRFIAAQTGAVAVDLVASHDPDFEHPVTSSLAKLAGWVRRRMGRPVVDGDEEELAWAAAEAENDERVVGAQRGTDYVWLRVEHASVPTKDRLLDWLELTLLRLG